MEKEQRSKLQKATQEARRLLEEEFSRQLLETYDINVVAGRWSEEPGAHLQAEQRLLREKLLAWIEHRSAQINDEKEALLLALREMAFTALNRFVALKLMEARELVRPCVSGGLESEGFQEFTAVAQGLLVEQESSYRLYLETIFEDVSRELRALFDPRDPASLLWPKRTALLDLLDILNRPELAELWREDETLGWIYQYFNGDAERKKMREESSAPRNSRELAVRNQFFTPRYVVEFLTDNTLGRIWYEMRQGQTGLKERCRYLVRRPDEVFLTEASSDEDRAAQSWLQSGSGERPGLWKLAHTVNGYVRAEKAGEESNRWVEERLPLVKPDKIAALTTQELLDLLFLFCRKERFCDGTLDSLKAEIDLILLTVESRVAKGSHTDLSQEDLLRQPEYIPHRPLKDPREIRMLDPACGSMHFGLYAFDLYLEIYTEAWEIAQGSSEQAKQGDAFAPFVAYAADFANKAAFLREVPRLILLHNIHGIDIDPRATQIARLTLWLRAQRAWQEQRVEVAARPAITRSNVVCAEPMPGERELLADFVDQQFPEAERGLVQQLLETIFDKMQLAGEAGSLLKIEEEIRDAIDQARRDWQKLAIQQRDLFSSAELTALGQVGCSLNTDLQSLTKDFWIDIEERIYAALSDYADEAESGRGLQRRLFAEDAAQGFAFIDVCRKRYDVALMNPPFGEGTSECDGLLHEKFPSSKGEIYAAFILQGANYLTSSGRLGAITSRACFFLVSLRDWRSDLFSGQNNITAFADLGDGVLDSAMVETTAYCLGKTNSEIPCIRLNRESAKNHALLETLTEMKNGIKRAKLYMWSKNKSAAIPALRLAYWTPPEILNTFTSNPRLESGNCEARVGFCTGDDFRYGRLNWEVASMEIGRHKRWTPFNKGGEAGSFYFDYHLVVDWDEEQKALRGFLGRPGRMIARPNGLEHFFRPGIAWPLRTQAGFATRVCPEGFIFSHKGPMIFHPDEEVLLALLSLTNTTSFKVLVSLQVAFGAYEVGAIQDTPVPDLMPQAQHELAEIARQCFKLKGQCLSMKESTPHFFCAGWSLSTCKSLAEMARASQRSEMASQAQIKSLLGVAENLTQNAYEISPEVLTVAAEESEAVSAGSNEWNCKSASEIATDILSYALGTALGRWDIRFATGELPTPEFPDPFAPLPICPPGQMQNALGLPAGPEDVPAAYPVCIPWDGILVDDANHPLDIELRIREVIGIIWSGEEGGATAESIEHEAFGILGVKSLRDYFRKPAGFFAEHLKRYSKSRRQAPIYWLLSAGSGSYSAWLYYHRFTQDTLYRVLGDFVDPRIQEAEREQFEFESQGGLSGDAASLLHEVQALLQDLRLFKSELELVAPLWNPNLNDGVIINHAILWRITPHAAWQKKCKECWDKLVKGDYDWAHLAFHLWPERVIRKCVTDRSLAIAHGLEERLWQETSKGNWLQRQVPEAELQALLAEYSKPAVQNALERFLAASPPVAAARTRAPRAAKSSSTGATRRPRGSAPEVDAETSRQTLLVLTAAPAEGLGKNAIAELLNVEAASLTAVIKQLKEGGQIEQLGAARGAKYRLSESGLAAVESQAGEGE